MLLAMMTFRGNAQEHDPRKQPGAEISIFSPEQHDLYDGRFIMSAGRIYMVGGLNDAPGWDHLGNDAVTVKPVAGIVEIDVDDLKNTGKFEARLRIPEGDLLLSLPKWRDCRLSARARRRLWLRR